MRTLHCSILTPEQFIYEGDVGFAVVQAYNGEMGFLVDHSPLIAELGVGEVRLSDGKTTEFFIVESGIVEIRDNKLIILAENALKKDDIDTAEVERKMKELEGMTFEPFSDERWEVKAEIDKMKMRLKVARR